MRSSQLAAAAVFTILSCALALGPDASAQTSAPPEKAPTEAGNSDEATADQDKLICRKDKVTGSRVRTTRICKTQAEWDDINRAGRASVDNMSRLLETTVNPRPRGN